jgi:hypothetical protein
VLYFSDWFGDNPTPAAHRQWAIAVAENVIWRSLQPHAYHIIEECWIDDELALCLRYSNRRGRYGVRFAKLEMSPITPPLPPRSTGEQGSNFYDVQLGGGEPGRCDWTEPDGREWWRDAPAAGWPRLLDPSSRLATLPIPEH